jgi:uncharacterized protein (DUF433 family)
VATPAGETEPQCIGGRAMKRGELIPVFQYLDFLREQATEDAVLEIEKE